jgi:hypothetical protein
MRYFRGISPTDRNSMSCDTIDTRIPKVTQDEWDWGITRAIAKMEPPQSSVSPCDPRETPAPTLTQQKLAKSGIKFLSAIIAEANDFLQHPFEDEDGHLVHTSPEAHAICCDLLVNAAILDFFHSSRDGSVRMAVPEAVVSSDERGGLRVEWVRDDANVHLVIPANVAESYIYTEVGGEYKIEAAKAETLANSLRNIT